MKLFLALSSIIALASADISNDGSCGPQSLNKFTCPSGNCCSQYGWCGTTSAYCGAYCQLLFGVCTGTPAATSTIVSSSAAASTSVKATATSSASAAPVATKVAINIDPNGSCGGTSQFTCDTGSSNSCCSQYGWCGATSDYCGTFCQTRFGSCTSSPAVSSSSAAVTSASATSTGATPTSSTTAPTRVPYKIDSAGTCGGPNLYSCSPYDLTEACCSSSGYCGATSDYCGTGCQSKFGMCGTLPKWTPEQTTVFQQCLKPGQFHITFDDGPLDQTISVLNTLKSKGVNATFFLIGIELATTSGVSTVARELLEGHAIGCHSQTHPDFRLITDAKALQEITLSRAAITKATGKNVRFFRFPYGDDSPYAMQYLVSQNMKVLHWNFDVFDWQLENSNLILQAYQQKLAASNPATDSFISLNHDINQYTAAVLPQLIDLVRSKGYTFVSLQDCIGVAPYF